MDALYHQTNQGILKIGECFQKLDKLKQMHADTESLEQEIQEKITFVTRNCEKLDILVQKEPPTRRHSSKMKVNQLKYDNAHYQNALHSYQAERNRKLQQERDREELLNRKFTKNDDTTIFIDYSVQHQRSLQSSNRGMDDLISSGTSILENLKDQRERIKGAHRRLMDVFNTLGLSNTTMRLIERRVREDKYILFGGMIVVLIFIVLVMIYLV